MGGWLRALDIPAVAYFTVVSRGFLALGGHLQPRPSLRMTLPTTWAVAQAGMFGSRALGKRPCPCIGGTSRADTEVVYELPRFLHAH